MSGEGEHLELTDIKPFAGETQYEKRSRENILSSTQNQLLTLRKHFSQSLKSQELLRKKGESSSTLLHEMLYRLLQETEKQIEQKFEAMKEKVGDIQVGLSGDVPKGIKGNKVKVLRNGKVTIGYMQSTKGPNGKGESKILQGELNLSYEEYEKRVTGKSITLDDYTVTLAWTKEGRPQFIWKRAHQVTPMAIQNEVTPTGDTIESSAPKPQDAAIELQKAKEIIGNLRSKIVTDTSPLSKKLFAGKTRTTIDFSRTTYASGVNEDRVDYAQIMEDGGKTYSVWGEITDQIRPLIIVDRENNIVLFSGIIGRDNIITPNSGFIWPKNRDFRAYTFQPKLNIQWKL